MTTWSAEELRRAALAGLGEHGDERARDALAHATLAIVPAVARWESSAGPVEGHRVTLGVDAGTLGTLRAAPSLVDALCASIATALSTRPGETLHELSLRWTPSAGASPSGYRDAPPPSPQTPLLEALVAYLKASGDSSLAALLVEATVDPTIPPEATIRMGAPDGSRFAQSRLERAVRDLLGNDTVRVRVR